MPSDVTPFEDVRRAHGEALFVIHEGLKSWNSADQDDIYAAAAAVQRWVHAIEVALGIVADLRDRVAREEATQRRMRIDQRDRADPLRNLWRRTVPFSYRERVYTMLTGTHVEISDSELDQLLMVCHELRELRNALTMQGLAAHSDTDARSTLTTLWATLDSRFVTSMADRLPKTAQWWDYRLAVLVRGIPGAVTPPTATRDRSPGLARQIARSALPGMVRRTVMNHVLLIPHPSHLSVPA